MSKDLSTRESILAAYPNHAAYEKSKVAIEAIQKFICDLYDNDYIISKSYGQDEEGNENVHNIYYTFQAQTELVKLIFQSQGVDYSAFMSEKHDMLNELRERQE